MQFRPGQVIDSFGIRVDKILSWDIQSMRIASMVDTAVTKLTGQTSVGKAWESLFPAGSSQCRYENRDQAEFFLLADMDMENDWSTYSCVPLDPNLQSPMPLSPVLPKCWTEAFLRRILPFSKEYIPGEAARIFRSFRATGRYFLTEQALYKDSRPGAPRIHWISNSGPLRTPGRCTGFYRCS